MTAIARVTDLTVTAPYDVDRVRADFPILSRTVHGKPLVYLDNAATTQKPRAVVDAIAGYYGTINANVHRGVHELSGRATDAFEAARERVRRFFNAAHSREIVFTRNATESINLVAWAFAGSRLREGDEVVISAMEHHSNIVPWQLVCERTGGRLRVAPIDDRGALIVEEFDRLLGPRTRLVSIAHMSNALGTINPVAEIVRMAHERDIPVLLDGSQAAYHLPVDVQALGCDFLAALRNQRHLDGFDAQCNRDHLVDARRLEVELGRNGCCKSLHVSVLYVAAILAQMRGDSVGASRLANCCRGHWTWLLASPCLS